MTCQRCGQERAIVVYHYQPPNGPQCDISLCGGCVSPIKVPPPRSSRQGIPTWHERIMQEDTV